MPTPTLFTASIPPSRGLYLPFVDTSPYPVWETWLINSSDMSQIGLMETHSRSLQLQLDNQNTFTGWVDLFDDIAVAIQPHSTGVRIDRDGETIYSGQIWQANENTSASGVGQQAGSDQLNIVSYGWFNVLGGSGGVTGYNSRLLHTGIEFQAMIFNGYTDSSSGTPVFVPTGGFTPNYLAWKAQNNGVDYTSLGTDGASQLAYGTAINANTTDAAIIFDLLDRANIDSPTLIQKGNIYGAPVQRNLTLQRFQVVGQEIQQLVNVEAGVDWMIDPLTRKMHLYGVGASPSPLIPNGMGIDRGQGTLFSYPGNCTAATRSRDGTRTQNRVEAIGQYAVGRADDLGSQATNGLLEAQDSLSEVTDPNILAAYANAEVAVLRDPWTILTFTPRALLLEDAIGPAGVPRPFDDYNLGDIVYGYVNRGSFQVGTNGTNPQACRLFGFTVAPDDDGIERVSNIQTSYQGISGS